MLYNGDCLEVMKDLDDNSVDTIITDPPYGLEFMGKDWDKGVPGVPFWKEMLRITKPGAMLLAMGGTRTYHRLVCAIEDAGWEIYDTIAWLYGSGFPKSHNISKAIDRKAGVEREVVGENPWGANRKPNSQSGNSKKSQLSGGDLGPHPGITAPATPEAQQWDGWGTALKPAMELICVAQKPREGTYVENALKWGVAGMWIDGARVGTSDALGGGAEKRSSPNFEAFDRPWKHDPSEQERVAANVRKKVKHAEALGRWPANVILSYPDDEYGLRDNVTPKQLNELARWLDENA
jgi:hypothetical protein